MAKTQMTIAQEEATKALDKAIRDSELDSARKAIYAGALVNGGPNTSNFSKPLTASINMGNAAMCKLLLQSGAQVDASHISNAASKKDLSVFRVFTESAQMWERSPESMLRYPLFASLFSLEAFEMAYEACPDKGSFIHLRGSDSKSALANAMDRGKKDVCAFLLSKGAKPDVHCLRIAVHKDFMLKNILEHGANPNWSISTGGGPLFYAAKTHHIEMCDLLIKAGANMDERNVDGDTPLLVAMSSMDTVLHLRSKGANLRTQNRAGNNLIFKMMELSRLDIETSIEHLKDLPEFERMITVKNDAGSTVLHAAAGHDKQELDLSVFLQSAAVRSMVNHQNKEGMTAVMVAAESGRHKAIQQLVEAGANLDRVNNNGDTALHLAFKGRHTNCIPALVMAGANVKKINRLNETAFDIAIDESATSSYGYLHAMGATTAKYDPMYLPCKDASIVIKDSQLIAAMKTEDMDFFLHCAKDPTRLPGELATAQATMKRSKSRAEHAAFLSSILAQRAVDSVMNPVAPGASSPKPKAVRSPR